MFRVLAAILVSAAVTLPALAAPAAKCMVTDPSGTQMNVRDKPGGKLLVSLANGIIVTQGEAMKDSKGREWVRIVGLRGDQKAKGGWAAKDLMRCF